MDGCRNEKCCNNCGLCIYHNKACSPKSKRKKTGRGGKGKRNNKGNNR